MLDKDIEKVLVSAEEIDEIARRLGKQLTEDYKDKFPIVVGLLKGCVPFMGRLVTEMDCHLELGFMDVSSYHGGIESTGDIKIKKDLDVPVQGRHVIIAEDIVDTGRTLAEVREQLLKLRPASLKIVTFLNKPDAMIIPLTLDYVGFRIKNDFVVGYGLDYDGHGRNLDDICVVVE